MNDSFQVLKYRLYENQICKTTICEDFLFFQRDIHQNFNNFVKYKSQKFSEIIKSTYNQTTLKMIHPHECLIPNNVLINIILKYLFFYLFFVLKTFTK